MANLPQVNNGETTTATTKINDVVDAVNGLGGTLLENGTMYLAADAPYLRLRDTGTSGIDARLSNDAGVLTFAINTGTEGSPTWTTVMILENA